MLVYVPGIEKSFVGDALSEYGKCMPVVIVDQPSSPTFKNTQINDHVIFNIMQVQPIFVNSRL